MIDLPCPNGTVVCVHIPATYNGLKCLQERWEKNVCVCVCVCLRD